MIKNDQAVLDILNFEKSSDLIGLERLAQKRGKGIFSEKSDSATFYPLYPPNFMQKIRKK